MGKRWNKWEFFLIKKKFIGYGMYGHTMPETLIKENKMKLSALPVITPHKFYRTRLDFRLK
jgi:hypothetical protein